MAMTTGLARRLSAAFAGLLLAVMGLAPATQAKPLGYVAPAMKCEALVGMALPPVDKDDAWARIETAVTVTANTPSPYCDVRGYTAPQVFFNMRLPLENWTQRMLYTGCGAFCGNDTIRVQSAETCVPVTNGELAIIASDLGHRTSYNGDLIWAIGNDQGRRDFGYRGVHVTTQTAKKIIAKFYGQPQAYAYFSGCSDGGREAMVEVQRFPKDFDGVIAGSPSIYTTLNNTAYHSWVAKNLLKRDGTELFKIEDLGVLSKAVLAACAGPDGLISDLKACKFDPRSLQCARGVSKNCLSADQVASAAALYAGVRDPKGKWLYYGMPRGSELMWNWQAASSAPMAENFVNYLTDFVPQTKFSVWDLPFDDDSIAKFKKHTGDIDALDPNLEPFRKAGGKLILWHGLADQSISPELTIDYYDNVRKTMGVTAADEFTRLYLMPGMYHCRGGPGPNKLDALTMLMAWVEDGVAPGALHVTTSSYGRVSRAEDIQPYPALSPPSVAIDPFTGARGS